MAKATLKSIAQEAGVSPMVVSAVARNDFSRIRVSEEKKEVISSLIKKYNYIANATAKSLVTRQTNLIALFVPSIRFFEVPFRQKLLIHVQELLHQHGLSISFYSYKDLKQLPQNIIADAGLFFYYGSGNDEAYDHIKRLPFPMLTFGQTPDNAMPSIYLDNFSAMKQLGEKIIAAGHKQLLLVNTFPGDNYNRDSKLGIEAAVNNAQHCTLEILNIPSDHQQTHYADLLFNKGQYAANHILEMRHRPSVAIFNSDTVALACMHKLKDAGLSIPRDLSIAANGSDSYAVLMEQTLTRVTNNPALCAQRICDALLALKQHNKINSEAISLDIEWRSSVANTTDAR